MTEVWKPIENLGKEFLVSNTGRVKSCDRRFVDRNGRTVTRKGRFYKQTKNSTGYYRVDILKKRYFVHRLVARAFCANPDKEKYNVVNHIDNDPANNNADNLEWTDLRGNTRHAMEQGRMNRTDTWLQHLRETNEKNGKSVAKINPVTNSIDKIYVCLNDVKLDGFQASCVCMCCQGKAQTHHGFRWEYVAR